MTTVELARKKWADKMKTAGPIWKDHVTDKVKTWAKAMADFLGVPGIKPIRQDRWSSGVDRVTADDFAKAVAGKDAKWADKLTLAMATAKK